MVQWSLALPPISFSSPSEALSEAATFMGFVSEYGDTQSDNENLFPSFKMDVVKANVSAERHRMLGESGKGFQVGGGQNTQESEALRDRAHARSFRIQNASELEEDTQDPEAEEDHAEDGEKDGEWAIQISFGGWYVGDLETFEKTIRPVELFMSETAIKGAERRQKKMSQWNLYQHHGTSCRYLLALFTLVLYRDTVRAR